MGLDPISVASIGQGVAGTAQAIFGAIQAKRAQDAIRELQKNAPDISVPTALRQLAGEPVAEEYIEAQEMGAQRRTSQSIDALSKGGSRTLAGALPTIAESERIGEMQRAGQYEQARNQAIGNLAMAEERAMRLRLEQYFRDLNAARGSLEAGQQNVGQGVGGVLSGASMFAGQLPQGGGFSEDYIMERLGGGAPQITAQMNPRQTPSGNLGGSFLQTNRPLAQSNFPAYPPASRQRTSPNQLTTDPITGLPNFKDGGIIKTKGVFSHRKNPKYLVDGKTGKVEAELTGNETIFNKDDSEKMEALSKKDKGRELSKFVRSRYKRFNAKRK